MHVEQEGGGGGGGRREYGPEFFGVFHRTVIDGTLASTAATSDHDDHPRSSAFAGQCLLNLGQLFASRVERKFGRF
jgi:hypothetical protein